LDHSVGLVVVDNIIRNIGIGVMVNGILDFMLVKAGHGSNKGRLCFVCFHTFLLLEDGSLMTIVTNRLKNPKSSKKLNTLKEIYKIILETKMLKCIAQEH